MNRNVTIGLVLVFALLLLYVLLVQVPQDQLKAAQTPTPFTTGGYVWTITSEQIAGARITNQALNQVVAFAKSADGTWTVTAPANRPADANQINTALYQFAGLYVSAEITTATDLAPFGVLSPTYTIEVNLMDGSALKAQVGNVTPLGSSYYVVREGETNVLVVSKASVDSLVQLVDAPPYLPLTPTPGFATPLPAQP